MPPRRKKRSGKSALRCLWGAEGAVNERLIHVAIDYHSLKNRDFPPVRESYEERDTMLYALTLGLGNDPLDAAALPYVYEGAVGGLKVLPTQAVVLGYPGFWAGDKDTGINALKLLHGEQRMQLHAPLPASGKVVGLNRITHLIDKGADRGAIMVTERTLKTEDGVLLATIQQVTFLKGDGGFSALMGGQPSDTPLPSLQPTPEAIAPDFSDTCIVRPEAALLYRLMGDSNPLHADPGVAAKSGFGRPILHGLATFGIAAFAVIRQCQHLVGGPLVSFDVRFSAPVFPGETLLTEIWRVPGKEGEFVLRAKVLERNQLVLTHGRATFALNPT